MIEAEWLRRTPLVAASAGSFYRLHATPEQFGRAYPQGRDFFERKRHYDPDELFQNQFYVKYGRGGR